MTDDITVETNGTISPSDAVKQTTQIIMDHFSVIATAANEMVSEMPMPAMSEESEEEAKPKKAKKAAKKKA